MFIRSSKLNQRNLPYLSKSLAQLPKFLNCPRGILSLSLSLCPFFSIEILIIYEIDSKGNVIVAKTGMGSSAALTTSLVAALLTFFKIINLKNNNNNNNNNDSLNSRIDHQRIHYLSQLIHAVAQGKIGSGFDISAAVYGSQTYQRFSELKIPFDEIINSNINNNNLILYQTVEDNTLWDEQIIPFILPYQMEVMMGDVCGGSSSSSMVRINSNYYYHNYNNSNTTLLLLLFSLLIG